LNIDAEPYYETVPKKETISHMFLNLVENIRKYREGRISIV